MLRNDQEILCRRTIPIWQRWHSNDNFVIICRRKISYIKHIAISNLQDVLWKDWWLKSYEMHLHSIKKCYLRKPMRHQNLQRPWDEQAHNYPSTKNGIHLSPMQRIWLILLFPFEHSKISIIPE